MLRSRLKNQLVELNTKLREMGSMIEDAINGAVEALATQDVNKAKFIIANDGRINAMENDIESLCFKTILTEQPVASDLRYISAAMKMITDMERIGDHAADISEIIVMIGKTDVAMDYGHISQMAEATLKMLYDSINAFIGSDEKLARSVCEYDDVVDGLFDETKHDIVELIRHNVKYSEQAVDLLMIAKYFERIGDHATNIAEWVIYSITGEHKTYNIHKDTPDSPVKP